MKNVARNPWRHRRLRSEPTSRLRENQNREKELFLKIASSRIFSYYCFITGWTTKSLGELDLKFLIIDMHSQKQSTRCVPWKNNCMFYNTQIILLNIVGNKAKVRISKRVFQGNKARQIFRKTNIFYSLIRTHTYVCVSGGKK